MERSGALRKLLGLVSVLTVLAVLPACEQEYQVVRREPKKITADRSLEISADETLYKPSIKVVLIVDNSDSMRDEQLTLADGIEGMLESMRGMKDVNVTFHLFTTSSLDNASPAQKATHVTETKFWAQSNPSELLPEQPGISLQANYVKETKRNLALPQNGDVKLELKVGMSESEFLSAKNAVASSIAAIGIDGDDGEAGLCTMGRALADDGPNRLFKKGDKVAFIIITDDDDYSTAENCIRKITETFNYDTSDPGVPVPIAAIPAEAQWFDYQLKYSGAATPAYYSFSYDYADSETYKVKVNYASPDSANWIVEYSTIYLNSWNHAVSASWSANNVFTAKYRYTYPDKPPGQCVSDGQPRVCTEPLLSSERNYVFDPAALGVTAPLSGSPAQCPQGLKDHIQANVLNNGEQQVLSTCTYTSTGSLGSISAVALTNEKSAELALTSPVPGTPPASTTAYSVGGMGCSAALKSFIIADRSLPADTVFTSCSYSYNENYVQTAQKSAPLPVSLGFTTGTTGNCPTTPTNVVALSQADAVALGKTYRNCRYYTRNSVTSADVVFNPADYGISPPSLTATNHVGGGIYQRLGNSCPVGGALETYSRSLMPVGATFGNCRYDYSATGVTLMPGVRPTLLEADAGPYSLPTACTSGSPCSCASYPSVYPWVATKSGKGQTPRTCSFTYTAGAGPTNRTCNMSDATSNVALNLCSGTQSFALGPSSYVNLGAYFTANQSKCTGSINGMTAQYGECIRTGRKNTYPNPAPKFVSSSVEKQTVSSSLTTATANFESAIITKARALFGPYGLFVAGILHDDDLPACSAGMAAAPGKKYRNLIQSLGDAGFVQSVCEPDYSPALNNIRAYILRTIANSFRVPLESNEVITEVYIRRKASEDWILLPIGTDAFVSGSIIDLRPGILRDGDTLGFKIIRTIYVRPDDEL